MVLDRLPVLKAEGPCGERRLRALAYLGALINLHSGRHELKAVAGPSGGLRALSSRTKVQVSKWPCK